MLGTGAEVVPFSLSCARALGQPPQACVCSPVGLKPTGILSRAQGAMWRGLALWQEVALGPSGGKRPQDRVQGQVGAGEPAPSSNGKAAEQGHLQRPKDWDSKQAEAAGAGDHPKHLAILLPLPGSGPPERPPCLVPVSCSPFVPAPALSSSRRGLRSGGVAGEKDA